MTHVLTVRDFTQIFDAYAEFEESLLSARMEEAEEEAPEEDGLVNDVDLRLARFESLMDRRPHLVNNVLLRANAQNVNEWLKRVALHEGDVAKQTAIFEEAIAKLLPAKAQGPLQQLWIDYATLYEQASRIDEARQIYERAIAVPFRHLSDLATVWIEWAEMELRLECAFFFDSDFI